jgi:hypothetical protein
MHIRSQTNYWELWILFEVQELAKICETAASLKPQIATVYTLSNNQKYGTHIHKKNQTCRTTPEKTQCNLFSWEKHVTF